MAEKKRGRRIPLLSEVMKAGLAKEVVSRRHDFSTGKAHIADPEDRRNQARRMRKVSKDFWDGLSDEERSEIMRDRAKVRERNRRAREREENRPKP